MALIEKLCKMQVPEKGFFPELNKIFLLNFDNKGNLVQKDGKWLNRADKLPAGEQEIIRSGRWHTTILEDTMKKELFEKCMLLVKSGPFQEGQLRAVQSMLKEQGLEIVMIPAKMVSGGRGKRVNLSKLLVADHQVIYDIARDIDPEMHKALMALPGPKRMGYLTMIIGDQIKFATPNDRPLKIKIVPGESNGRSWISSEIAGLNDFKHVCKLGRVSKDIAIVNDRITGIWKVDLVMCEDSNKFKLSEEKIAELVRYRPKCHPLNVFDKNLPTFRWDILMAQNINPDPELDDIKSILETGRISPEFVWEKMSYETRDGNRDIMQRLRPLMLGGSINDPSCKYETTRALTTLAVKRFFKHSWGKCGILCDIREIPGHIKQHKVVAFLYPNQRPISCVAKTWDEAGMIGIDKDIISKEGRDLDGDIVVVVPHKTFKFHINSAREELVLPEKKKGECKMDDFAIWAKIVANIRNMGSIHNDSIVLLSTAIKNNCDEKTKIQLINDTLFYDETYIHGFKHGFNEKAPNLKERAQNKKMPMDDIKRETEFSRTVRNGSISDWIETANTLKPEEAGGFFEKVVKKLENWKTNTEFPRNRHDRSSGQHLTDEEQKLNRINKIRARSFISMRDKCNKNEMFTSDDWQMRWGYCKKELKKEFGYLNKKLARMFILSLFIEKDREFANWLYARFFKTWLAEYDEKNIGEKGGI